MLTDDLFKFSAWVEYCHWKEYGTLSSLFSGSNSFQSNKTDMIHRIKGQMYLSLQKYLLPNYEQYASAILNALKKCRFSDSIWIPKSKSNAENEYSIADYEFPKDLFQDIESDFAKRLNLSLRCIAMEDNEDYYWQNLSFDYDRVTTMNAWKNGHPGVVVGKIRMFISSTFNFDSESIKDIVYAIMGFLLRVYLDYLSFSSDEWYVSVTTTSYRRKHRQNFNDMVKAKDPCLNLIGKTVCKLREIKQTIEADPEDFASFDKELPRGYGTCPEDDIKIFMDILKSSKGYKILEEVEESIVTIKELSRSMQEYKLCQMWNRSFKNKANSYGQLFSVLDSMFDNVKNYGLEIISFYAMYRLLGLNTCSYFLA